MSAAGWVAGWITEWNTVWARGWVSERVAPNLVDARCGSQCVRRHSSDPPAAAGKTAARNACRMGSRSASVSVFAAVVG